jgi:hypothetical protein
MIKTVLALQVARGKISRWLAEACLGYVLSKPDIVCLIKLYFL